ncbi:MAG: hypothetical protein Q4G22_10230 [Paracoccus sp. (in: a-proteobacteria)]|uniref:hypothetical protein n=1 Tax=Paracoccus sp. TaxID=267 RepID=UPI0026E04399|nr:hypothetical protein [Paracoccus sp. (in: a-proteobacteria)]MDO5632202.1 hypothetical protein [Paracoccus sp. (in: a-proteobacteria)]
MANITDPIQPLFIRINDAARRYSVSVSTINRAFANGELTRHKRGHCTLILLAEADAWAMKGVTA